MWNQVAKAVFCLQLESRISVVLLLLFLLYRYQDKGAKGVLEVSVKGKPVGRVRIKNEESAEFL